MIDDQALDLQSMPEEVIRTVTGYQEKMAGRLISLASTLEWHDWASKRKLPEGFLSAIKKVMDLYDESSRYLLTHLRRNGRRVQCGPGCAFCCQQMPAGISGVEFIYLYHGIWQTGNFSRLMRRCLERDEKWTQICGESFTNLHNKPVPDQELALRLWCYEKLEQDCPFLQDKRCCVYPYRPFACRMHYSLTPQAWCRPSHFQHDHVIRINLEPGECVYNALEKLDARLDLKLSNLLMCGLLELSINVLRFEKL